MDELRAAVRDLATAPSAESADLLVQRLASTAPSPELAAFISETLELTALHQVKDSSGTTVRWRLIDRLLGLGFPHALCVTPDDLDYHRERSASSSQVPAALTLVTSTLSTLWFVLLGVVALASISGSRDWKMTLATLLVLLGAAHGVAAFTSALKASRGERAPLLAPLGWSFFAGLGAIGLGSLMGEQVAMIGLVVGAPGLVTAMLCGLTAALTQTRPPEAPIAPAQPREPKPARAPRANVRA